MRALALILVAACGSHSAATDGTTGGDADAAIWWRRLVKIDAQTGAATYFDAGDSAFIGHPAFAPRAGATGEDDGWLLTYLLDAARETTDVVILDAKTMTPVSTLKLGVPLPQLSHTRWEPEAKLRFEA